MSKSKCKKGYSCGASCISVTYQCRKEYPQGVSVSIDGARKVMIASMTPTPKKKSLEGDWKSLSKSKDYDASVIEGKINMEKVLPNNNVVSMTDSITKDSQGGNSHYIAFKINDDFDEKNIPKRDALVAARTLDTMFKDILDRSSPGDIFIAIVHRTDGQGDKRQRAYEKKGFLVNGSLAVARLNANGKLEPYDL